MRLTEIKISSNDEVDLSVARRYIYSIDFSLIINKMVEHEGWLHKDASAVCEMYRNFLYLNRKYRTNHGLPPSEEIDEFWHHHILDTKKYRRDCEAIFGEYFDHYPYFGIDEQSSFSDLEDAFEAVQKIYAKEFGHRIYQIRNVYSVIAAFFKNKFKAKVKRRGAVTL